MHGVCFGGADDLVMAHLAVLVHFDAAAQDNAAGAMSAVFVDQGGAAEDVLDFEDATLDHALFELGVVVFGVVLAGTKFLGVVNAVGDDAALLPKLFEFFFELCLAFTCQRDLFLDHVVPLPEANSGPQKNEGRVPPFGRVYSFGGTGRNLALECAKGSASMAEDYGGRERRATDGLNWVRDTDGTPAAPPPAAPAPPPGGKTGPRTPGLGMVAIVAAVSAIVGGALVAGSILVFGGDDDGSADRGANGGSGGTLTVEQTSAVADAAERARPAIIKLQSTRRTAGGTEQDVGSGVLIDADGHVATNAHVVLGTDTLKAILPDGSERPAVLVGHDYPFTDVAVVLIGPTSIAPLEIGDSAALKLGETILAIGNPLAEFDGSVTVGVVSGTNRKRVFDGVVQRDLIQTDAAINSGNSGGALVNLRGQFVGMPTTVLRQGGASAAAVEGMAFALPSNRVMQIVRGIIAARGSYPRPTMGLESIDITPETLPRLRTLGMDHGAVVTAVAPGGPAANAGIERGDVITKIGDVELASDTPLLNALLPLQPEQTVKVVLNRAGRIIETDVRLVRRT